MVCCVRFDVEIPSVSLLGSLLYFEFRSNKDFRSKTESSVGSLVDTQIREYSRSLSQIRTDPVGLVTLQFSKLDLVLGDSSFKVDTLCLTEVKDSFIGLSNNLVDGNLALNWVALLLWSGTEAVERFAFKVEPAL